MKLLFIATLSLLPLNGAFGSFLNRFGIEEARVGAEFLWWKPIVDNLDYGYTAQGNVIPLDKTNSICFQYEGISPKWAPGVRVNLSLPICTWDVTASATWIKSHGHATLDALSDNIENSHVVNTLIHPYMDFVLNQGNGWFNRSIVSDWRSTYVNADLLLNYNLCCTSNFEFTPYLGIAGIWVKQQQHSKSCSVRLDGVNIDAPTACMTWNAKYWGVGLEAGASFERRICTSLAFFGNVNTTLVAGKIFDGENRQALKLRDNERSLVHLPECDRPSGDCNQYLNLNFQEYDCKAIVPGWHIQGGLNYKRTIACLDVSFRVGYEFLYWLNLPNPRRFDMSFADDQFAGGAYMGRSSDGNTRSLGFHGLFIGADFGF